MSADLSAQFPDRLSEPLPRVSLNKSAVPGGVTITASETPSSDFSGQCSIQVLARSMALLDVLARQIEPVSLKYLAQQTRLHASTAHRILNDLVVGRYVERVDSGMYQLGLRLLELGALVKERLNVRTVALNYMHELHKLTGQTINLAVQQGDEIVYVERAWSERSGMQVVRSVGGRAPLHLTSTGKLFLSVSDARQIKAYATRTGLTGTTRNSITRLEQLEQDLKLIRQRGYARDNEELELGVRCMAAGIYDDSGSLQAGLSISAPSERLRDEWIAVLQYVAGQISTALGFVDAPGKLFPEDVTK